MTKRDIHKPPFLCNLWITQDNPTLKYLTYTQWGLPGTPRFIFLQRSGANMSANLNILFLSKLDDFYNAVQRSNP